MPTRLTDRCWLVELRGVNAYLVADLPDGVDDPHEADPEEYVLTLVDAGTPLDAGRLKRAVAETGHSLSEIERVLVTHYDVDHVGALSRLALDATVYMGGPDADYLTGRKRPPTRAHKGALQRAFAPLLDAPGLTIETVRDDDRVGSFTVYHTPGHTQGHMAYVSDTLSLAFVGDLVMEKDGDLHPSPWVLSYDTEAVRESIHDLADREPAVEVLGMGHGVPFLRDGSVRLARLGQTIE
ncbi:MBL fold metallo-hydrolase [Halomarina litorea]|uniref:MBL fold metallo-hydrolase n=1 Tax=Halomarina litorea TaxID=2961595 RepID=UPI0020C2A04B|nr:MBL fold metallo-hydrolase [Halomarina sp. BCD28]